MNKTGGLILYFKIYYKVTIIKTAQYWYKDRQVDEWNDIENPDRNPYIYMDNFLSAKVQRQYSEERIAFS